MTVHHDDHDEIREVVGHLELPPHGLTERYKLRVQLFPLDDEGGGYNDDDQNDPYYAASPTIRTPRGLLVFLFFHSALLALYSLIMK